MGAAIESGKPQKGPKPNINVTPLVDVVLVLLIIFMVIIPNMQEGKAIELVKVFHPDKEAGEQQEPLVVTITDAEAYNYDERDLPRAQVLAELTKVYQAAPKRKILLRADARLRFSIVRGFFKEVQEIGFGGVSLAVAGEREWSPTEEGGK
ncbi:MAG TPA: biopolymer transporter ExbD [Nannocystaceae bacterium]|nr:biopolymer transporter ExbD [Nannocystaceae bacterium]